MDALKQHDAILFGAIGADPRSGKIPSGLIEREMLLKLRFAFDHYINLRPSRLYPGAVSPLANPGKIRQKYGGITAELRRKQRKRRTGRRGAPDLVPRPPRATMNT